MANRDFGGVHPPTKSKNPPTTNQTQALVKTRTVIQHSTEELFVLYEGRKTDGAPRRCQIRP